MKTVIAVAVVAAFCCSAAPAASQSLADVAKKEEARRGGVRAPSKKLTNSDLSGDPREASPDRAAAGKAPAAPIDSAASMAAAAPSNASADGQAPQPPAAAAAKEEPLPESWWRTRAQGARARLATARKNIADLDGPPSPDERQQAKVAKLLKAAQEALERAEHELQNLEMHADVAGVPKDWIK